MGVQIHEDRFGVFSFTLNIANCVANATTAQAYSIRGVRLGDYLMVNPQASLAGLGIAGVRVTGLDAIEIKYINPTAAPINPGNTPFLGYWHRAENVLPAAVLG